MFPVGPNVPGPLTILIVDGSAMLRTMLKRVTQLSGVPIATILEAAERFEALDVMRRCPVDAVFVNIDAENTQGVALLGEIAHRADWDHVIRVVTGTTNLGRQHELDRLKVRGFLETPFRPERIRELLWGLIDGTSQSVH